MAIVEGFGALELAVSGAETVSVFGLELCSRFGSLGSAATGSVSDTGFCTTAGSHGCRKASASVGCGAASKCAPQTSETSFQSSR